MLQIGQEVKPATPVATGQAPGQANFSYGQVSSTAPGKIVGLQNVNGETYYNVDQKGIGGGTGWVKGSELEQAVQTLAPVQPQGANQPVNPSTAVPSANTTTSGIPQRPSINLQSIYDTNYGSEDIKQAQATIDKINADITARKEAYDKQLAIETDNPFYSEDSLVGAKKSLDTKFNNDMQTKQQELANAQNKLTTLKGGADNRINIALKQYDINNQEYMQNLQQFSSLLSAGALNNASPSDIASLSSSTGISPDMIQSIVETQKNKDVKLQMITETDENGNVTIAAVDTRTGNIVNQQSLNGAGKSSGGSGSGYNKTVDKYLNTAIDILKDQDTSEQTTNAQGNKYKLSNITGDKALSRGEFESAYNRIKSLVGDEATAKQLMDRAWSTGGYTPSGW